MSKDVECWCSYLPVPAVTSSHHWLRGVGPATSSITKAASSWRKRHRQAVAREKRTFVQQPRRKHSWKPEGKKTNCRGFQVLLFWEKMNQLEDPIDYKTKPFQHKTYPKNKTKYRSNQKSSKISSKGPRMGAASNGTFTSNFSVTLIRQRALMAPLSSPGSSCRFNGLRPKFIGKDCAVPSPKKPGRKSERWDSGLANSVLDRSWIEIDDIY